MMTASTVGKTDLGNPLKLFSVQRHALYELWVICLF